MAADKFRARETVVLPEASAPWATFEAARAWMDSRLVEVTGAVHNGSVIVRAADQSVLTRKTVWAAQDAAEASDFVVEKIGTFLTVEPRGDLSPTPWTTVKLYLTCGRKLRLSFEIESEKRLVRDGLVAAARGFVEKLEAGSLVFPSRPVSNSDGGGWVKRIWRDHSMTFVVSVVAGVVVLFFGAWLGLGGG